jgi:ketosteroid isomerase-like protein
MSSTTARTDLPPAIAAYLDAHIVRDADRAISLYHADATVTDEGKTYTGQEEIRGWLQRAASEYTYTTTLNGFTQPSPDQVQVAIRLEGNFPGGVADVTFDFLLRDDKIVSLVIG